MHPALLLLPLLFTQDRATPDRFAPVRAGLEQAAEAGAYHHVVAAVEIDGERVLTHAEGVEADAIFRVFSMTKPITAAGALTLVDEGVLDLDAPVAEYLPAFAGAQVLEVERVDGELVERRVPAERPMTVRDLGRHTSGLTYGFFGAGRVDRMVQEADLYSGDLAHLVEELAALPLKHHPGERFEYSLSSDVLGRVVEVVSGEPLDEFLEARLFEPMGMHDTGFRVPTEDLDRVPPLHVRRDGELVEDEPGGMPPLGADSGPFLGGAGLYSTAGDYLRFCHMLRNGGELGGRRVLSETAVQEMTRDQLGNRPGGTLLRRGDGFGLGLAVVTGEPRGAGPPPGTVWWGGAAGTGFWIDFENDLAGVFLIQNWMELLHWHRFQTDVYRALR